jgi:hypothetical protein
MFISWVPYFIKQITFYAQIAFFPRGQIKLNLIKQYAMMTFGGMEVYLQHSWPQRQREKSDQFPTTAVLLPEK